MPSAKPSRAGISAREPKVCVVCGRTIAWRKKWERDWEGVKYCSKTCRRAKATPVDADLERAILALLRARAVGATICPSEAARKVEPENWRDLLEASRSAARRLVDAGSIEITQQGRPVDPSSARGPIRLRLVR